MAKNNESKTGNNAKNRNDKTCPKTFVRAVNIGLDNLFLQAHSVMGLGFGHFYDTVS